MARKLICILIICVLIFTSCDSYKADELPIEDIKESVGTASEIVSKGEFVETVIAEYSVNDYDPPAYMYIDDTGSIHMLMQNYFDTTGEWIMHYDIDSQGIGVEQPITWQDEIPGLLEKGFISNFTSAKDGSWFFSSYTDDYKKKIGNANLTMGIWHVSGDTAEQIVLPESIADRIHEIKEFRMINEHRMLLIWYENPDEGYTADISDCYRTSIIDLDSCSEILPEINFGIGFLRSYYGENDNFEDSLCSVTCSKDTIFAHRMSGEVIAISAVDGKVIDEVINIGNDYIVTRLSHADDDYIYFLTSYGINRVARGGILTELILDASSYGFGSPAEEIINVSVCDEDNIYVLVKRRTNMTDTVRTTYKILGYRFDEDRIVMPKRDLSVLVISESKYLSRVVDIFKKENQDIRLIYDVVDGYERRFSDIMYPTHNKERTEKNQEILGLLQKELAVGRGPDIIIVDADIIGSLGEKGYLFDLTGCMGSEYLDEVFLTSMQYDNEIHAFPTDIMIPTISGKTEELATLNSINTMLNYFSKHGKTDRESGFSFYWYLFNIFYPAYSNNMFSEGRINIQETRAYLDVMKFTTGTLQGKEELSYEEWHDFMLWGAHDVYKPGGLGTNTVIYVGSANNQPGFEISILSDFCSKTISTLCYYSDFGYTQYTNGSMIPMFYGTTKTLTEYSDGYFIIREAIAINKNSKSIDDAVRFLEYYFGDKVNLSDAPMQTPVKAQTAQKMIEMLSEGNTGMIYPPIEDLEFDVYSEIYSKLKHPVIIDNDIMEIFCRNTYQYCFSDISLEDIIENIERELEETKK